MTDLARSERPPAVVVPPADRLAKSSSLWNSRLLGVAFIGLLLILWEIAAANAIFPPMSPSRYSLVQTHISSRLKLRIFTGMLVADASTASF